MMGHIADHTDGAIHELPATYAHTHAQAHAAPPPSHGKEHKDHAEEPAQLRGRLVPEKDEQS